MGNQIFSYIFTIYFPRVKIFLIWWQTNIFTEIENSIRSCTWFSNTAKSADSNLISSLISRHCVGKFSLNSQHVLVHEADENLQTSIHNFWNIFSSTCLKAFKITNIGAVRKRCLNCSVWRVSETAFGDCFYKILSVLPPLKSPLP